MREEASTHGSGPHRSSARAGERDIRRHDASVAAEIRHLERHLRSLGPMPRERLAELAHANRWAEGTFEEAVRQGVLSGHLHELPFGWLSVHAAGEPTDGPKPPEQSR